MTENNGEPQPLTPDEESAVHELLAALPDPQLPADVRARLTSAVAADREPSSSDAGEVAALTTAPPGVAPVADLAPDVLAPSAPSGRWRSTWLLQSAAVLVIVALIGAVVVGVVRDDGGSGGADAPLALSQETAGPITTSGREYTAATLAGQVRGLVVGAPASAAPKAAAPQGGTEADAGVEDDSAQATSGGGSSETLSFKSSSGWSTADPAVAKVTALVTDPAKRQACIDQLSSEPGAKPVAIDAGLYQGKPAAIFVLPDENDPERIAAWVVGPTCSSADNPFPYRYERVVRP